LEDLDEVIKLDREALMLQSAPNLNRALVLEDLAYELGLRFRQTGRLSNLDEAVAVGHEALILQPKPNANRARLLTTLGVYLSKRFDSTSQKTDLDDSIVLFRGALNLYPGSSNRERLSQAIESLTTRYNHFGATEDLEELDRLWKE
ncbi:hypothetical protein JAAARDRAFT_92300, partial [Jaapia argillacea MUCL 33604]